MNASGEARRPLRVAHLVSHPIPYFAPLYRELASRPDLDLTVYFYSDVTTRGYQDPEFGRVVDWDVPLLDGYRSRILPSATRRPTTDAAKRRPNLDLIWELFRGRYDVVWVHGYSFPNAWLAYLGSWVLGFRFVLREEAILVHRRVWWRRAVKYVPLRVMGLRAWGMYIGTANRGYLERYGFRPGRLRRARYTVDTAFFEARRALKAPRRDEFRRGFGVPDDRPVILFVGKFIDKKRPLDVVRAFAEVRSRFPCALVMVGSGPLEDDVRALIAQQAIPDVCLAGFKGQEEVVDAYLAADAFVLYSGDFETWGLVINEALAFGLPVVVSDKVGSSVDLVEGTGTGIVVPHDDPAALVAAFTALVDDAGARAEMGAKALAVAADYTTKNTADDIASALRDAAAGRRGRRSGARAEHSS